MKIIYLLALAILPQLVQGQIILHDTIFIDEVDVDPQMDLVAANTLYNNLGVDGDFRWMFTIIEKPDEWGLTVCDANYCYGEEFWVAELFIPNGDSSRLDAHLNLNGLYMGRAEIEVIVEKVGFVSDSVKAVFIFDIMTTGIEESAIEEVHFFPNPVDDFFRVSTIEEIAHYEILNMSGQRVVEKTSLSGNLINMEHLIPASYIVVFYKADGSILGRERLIKK